MNLPERFTKWAFHDRGEMIRRMKDGEDITRDQVFLNFTRHTPTIITHGKAGINGSIKGTGFLPKDDYLDELLESFLKHIEKFDKETHSKRGLELLHEMIWTRSEKMKVDHLATVDMALNQTWTNIKENPSASLLFYQPPVISFELKCEVKVYHPGDKIHTLVNAQHDVYHYPNSDIWDKRLVYEFIVNKIYDKSATKAGFGKLIWER